MTKIVVNENQDQIVVVKQNNIDRIVVKQNSIDKIVVKQQGVIIREGGGTTLEALLDTNIPNPQEAEVLTYNATSGLWESKDTAGGGASTFTELTDTPADYTGQANKVVTVKGDELGLEFSDAPPTVTAWGDIVGTLSDQTDLQSELDDKEDAFTKNTAFNRNFGSAANTVTEGNDPRLTNNRDPNPHTHVEVDITDLDKYTQAEVDALLANKEDTFTKNTAFNKNFGSAAGTVTEGNDVRLSDNRDPNPHTHVKADITDSDWISDITNESIGDLSDVDLTGIASGQIIEWTGTQFVPGDKNIGGGSTFISLSDTPVNYTGSAGKVLAVNVGENAVEFIDAPNSAVWGNITGTLSDQTDLQNALNGKAPTVHTHTKSQITDFSDGDYATAAQGTTADSAAQPGDNVSIFTNDIGYITAVGAPVQSVAGKTGVVTLVEADITDLDKYTQTEVDNLLTGKANTVHTHVEADVTDLDRIKWKNRWAQTEYHKNEMVFDEGWTMIANKTTTDRAAPQPNGDPAWILPDAPTFATNANTSVIYSGHEYTFTEAVWLKELRVWVPALSGTTHYRFVMIDRTDPATPIVTIVNDPVLKENEWTSIAANNLIVRDGSVLELYIDALNSGASTLVTGGWAYNGTSQSGAPLNQGWNRDNQSTIFRIDYEDLDSVDRTSELQGVTQDSTILVNQTNDNNRYDEYLVTGPGVDNTTYITFPVVLLDRGGTITQGENCSLQFDIPIPQSTDYSETATYWSVAGQPSFATVKGLLSYDGVVQPGKDDSAFGIDIKVQPAYVSPDWDLVSNISTSSSGGGDGGGDGIGEAPEDGTPYARQDAKLWVSTINDITN